jgi:hypothetical protein
MQSQVEDEQVKASKAVGDGRSFSRRFSIVVNFSEYMWPIRERSAPIRI